MWKEGVLQMEDSLIGAFSVLITLYGVSLLCMVLLKMGITGNIGKSYRILDLSLKIPG